MWCQYQCHRRGKIFFNVKYNIHSIFSITFSLFRYQFFLAHITFDSIRNSFFFFLASKHGETAILIAVWHGFPKIVHILGEIGADTNMMNKVLQLYHKIFMLNDRMINCPSHIYLIGRRDRTARRLSSWPL